MQSSYVTFTDLFCGAGGSSEGARQVDRGVAMLTSIELFAGIAGFSSPYIQPIAFVEADPSCRAILRRHHPDALILDDVRTSGRHNLPWAPVVKGGFPCQGLSVAGKGRISVPGP